MSTLTTFQTLLDDRVRETGAHVTAQQKERAIQQALKEYSQVRPLTTAQDYPGDGATYDFALPIGWQDGVSTIPQIEYPAGERQPQWLEREDWIFYQTPVGKKFRLMTVTPDSGKTMRVTFTKLHLLDATQSTIGLVDEEAVADLAAAIGLTDLAAHYANTQSATITADSVNYGEKSRIYLDLAKELKTRYRKHLGLDSSSDAPPVGGFVDQDRQASDGRDLLTHPRRLR